jgi:hypothetical protein
MSGLLLHELSIKLPPAATKVAFSAPAVSLTPLSEMRLRKSSSFAISNFYYADIAP